MPAHPRCALAKSGFMCNSCPHSLYHEQSLQSGENENHRQREQAWHNALHATKAFAQVPITDFWRGHEPLLRLWPAHGRWTSHFVDACVMPHVPATSRVPSTRAGAGPRLSRDPPYGSCGTFLTTRPLCNACVRNPTSDPKSLGVGATQNSSRGSTWRGSCACCRLYSSSCGRCVLTS